MASRRPEGTALLVAGHGAFGALDASALNTLGKIGEALLATGAAWQIRRLASVAGERVAPDRGALKQHLDELSGETARAAVLVVLGSVMTLGSEPALVTGGQAREYPEDATLPLRWIRERLCAARAEQLVAVVSAHGESTGEPEAWLRALGTNRAPHMLAIAQTEDDTHPIVDALLTALCGDALDPRTGTVTMASLSSYLRRLPGVAMQMSDVSETLAQPPPFAGLWDVRRSQLSLRASRARTDSDAEDLTGTVLPGRFRIDSVVARGTFGTVYRARQLAVERDVAVKVLHADIDPASDDGRLFVQEIRSVGRIDHPNVVGIHQADITADGRLFYAMEFLAGRDLQNLGDHGPLPIERAIELVRQLLAGLRAAHDAGLVHADVKPANAIVVERDGAERVVLVDFGLARLRAPDHPTESAGGTPAYMAPEQMHLGRVDARSDLFSAALVLVYLLTGWRRLNANALTPPLDIIHDPELRAVLDRALKLDPAERYQTALELSSAITGASSPPAPEPPAPPAPFRQLAPFTEDDRGRLFGREADLAMLTQHVLYRRSIIYTAPSGTGKTSMLRAGLVPRLEVLGVRAVYLRCRTGVDCAAALASAIWPAGGPRPESRRRELASGPASGGPVGPIGTIADAVAAWHRQRGGKLVLILDQVEAALGDDSLVRDVLGFAGWPADADVAVVLSIREDHLARLYAPAQAIEPGVLLVRLPPLGLDGARAAIIGPLTEARLAIDPDLLEALLTELQRAASAIGAEMGWGTAPAVFPPHLQLACSVLYGALGSGEATLTLDHYRRLGGFDAIVGEHFERVLDTQLVGDDDRIARALFLALVTGSHERAMRSESELIAMVGDAERVVAVLDVLRSHGLVMRLRGSDGEASWELAHDSLVQRVLAWVDARDLARRRAIELVRHHLRRSRADAPSLLSRDELRELKPHPSAIAELDAEWQRRGTTDPWSPSRLIARSRQVLRRQIGVVVALVVAVVVAGYSLYRGHVASQRQEREAALKLRDLGRVVFSFEPFDWAPAVQRGVKVDPGRLDLHWELRGQEPDGGYGQVPLDSAVIRGTPRVEGGALVEHVEVRGGNAFLLVRRGACSPSVIPLRDLPGYARRDQEATLHIAVPTCDATRADTIPIPEGSFLYGGVGEPPSPAVASDPEAAKEPQRMSLPAFRIDRREVSNAAFEIFSAMSPITGISPASYPVSRELAHAGEPRKPVTGINWHAARAYCRFLGKDLPTSYQWVKAMRGGAQIDGKPNPRPDRNLPWGDSPGSRARIADPDGVADVGSYPDDVSPYGVLDMAGNAQEWTSTRYGNHDGIRIVRGGHAHSLYGYPLVDFMALENQRAESQSLYNIGMRCVLDEP